MFGGVVLTIYGYKKCGTCRKATKWFDENKLEYTYIDIVTEPPSAETLQAILDSGTVVLKKLFNTSGQLYRSMNMKEKLPTLSESEAVALLAENGKLIKRPIVTDGEKFTVGFKEETYEKTWK